MRITDMIVVNVAQKLKKRLATGGKSQVQSAMAVVSGQLAARRCGSRSINSLFPLVGARLRSAESSHRDQQPSLVAQQQPLCAAVCGQKRINRNARESLAEPNSLVTQ